jgi:hypothetical protein
MNENVLREFLVSLGFEVDQVGLKKFNTAVEGVTKSVLAAGAAVAATAAGVVAGVKVISSQMENLYYASQRTGATVGNLMALRYAAGQIGLTAEQAQGSLENFTRTLRLNPGSNSLLSSLGVTGGDPTEKFANFIAKMKGMQPYVAAAYASLFGIDPDTLLMLENGLPKLEAEQGKYKDRLGRFGIDSDQAAKAGIDFNNTIRRATSDFELLWVVIESKLVPVLTPLIERFERWAENHAGDAANAIADAVQRLADWLSRIDWNKTLNALDRFVTLANDAAKAVGGWGNALLILAGLKLAGIIGGIGGLTAALTALLGVGAGFAGWKVGDLIRDKVDGLITRMSGRKYRSLSDVLTGTDRSQLDATGGYTQAELDSMKDGGGAKLTPPRQPIEQFGKIVELPPERPAPRGIRNNNPGNLRYGSFARQLGATGPDGGGFAVFSSMQDGIQAAIRLLESYASRGFDTIRKIISKWAPSNENNTEAYIAAVVKKLGVSADSRLSGNQLVGVAGAIFGHENGSAYANASALMSSSQNTRLGASPQSSRAVNVTQTNTYHIAGTADPQGTARAVGAEQSRVNGDLVRNFAGAVQ